MSQVELAGVEKIVPTVVEVEANTFDRYSLYDSLILSTSTQRIKALLVRSIALISSSIHLDAMSRAMRLLFYDFIYSNNEVISAHFAGLLRTSDKYDEKEFYYKLGNMVGEQITSTKVTGWAAFERALRNCDLKVNIGSVALLVHKVMMSEHSDFTEPLTDPTISAIVNRVKADVYRTIKQGAPRITKTMVHSDHVTNEYVIPEAAETVVSMQEMRPYEFNFSIEGEKEGIKVYKIITEAIREEESIYQQSDAEEHQTFGDFQLTFTLTLRPTMHAKLIDDLNDKLVKVVMVEGLMCWYSIDKIFSGLDSLDDAESEFKVLRFRVYSSFVHMLDRAKVVCFQQYTSYLRSYSKMLKSANRPAIQLHKDFGVKYPSSIAACACAFLAALVSAGHGYERPDITALNINDAGKVMTMFLDLIEKGLIRFIGGNALRPQMGYSGRSGYHNEGYYEITLREGDTLFCVPPGTSVPIRLHDVAVIETLFEAADFMQYLRTIKTLDNLKLEEGLDEDVFKIVKEIAPTYGYKVEIPDVDDFLTRLVYDANVMTTNAIGGQVPNIELFLSPKNDLSVFGELYYPSCLSKLLMMVSSYVTRSFFTNRKSVKDVAAPILGEALKRAIYQFHMPVKVDDEM